MGTKSVVFSVTLTLFSHGGNLTHEKKS